MNAVEKMHNDLLFHSLAVHNELRKWCDTFEHGYNPIPSVTVAGYFISLSVGDILVWDSENGYADELERCESGHPNAHDCIVCYRNQLEMMLPPAVGVM